MEEIPTQRFRKLQVWQKSIIFIGHVYQVSGTYPKHELFGLIDQIRRAATAVALNIAEGSGAGTDKEFARFLRISYRSLYEVLTVIEIASLLKYGKKIDNLDLINEADELLAMISSLLRKLKADS